LIRGALIVLAMLIAADGCSGNQEKSTLRSMAPGLTEAWQPVAQDMKLDLQAETGGKSVVLRGVLRNLSAGEIVVNRESLPWDNADAFSVSIVTSKGKVIRQRSIVPAAIFRIGAPPAPVAVVPGGSIEGNLDLGLMRIDEIPRNEDVLILWSYPRLKEWNSEKQYALSGILLLPARSETKTQAFTTTPLSSQGGTSVITQQMKQGLHDATESIVIDDTVIRLMAFPWRNQMPMAISPGFTPPGRPLHLSFRLISDPGTRLPSTLRVQSVWLVQNNQLWSGSDLEETIGAATASSRDFIVHAGPQWSSDAQLDVVVAVGDSNDTVKWLAARNQRIGTAD
jgi:hypothetical protein